VQCPKNPENILSPLVTSSIGTMVNPYIREYKNVVVNKKNRDIMAIKIHKDA
jgi:hypothetical protein